MRPSSGIRRRTVLVTGVSGLVSVSGCFGDISGGNGHGPHTYELTIDRPGQDLEMRIESGGESRDVIRIHVGDTAVLHISNDAGDAVGVHNHANDEQVVIESGTEQTMEFEATEEMTGRHEIEGWTAEGDGNGTPAEHGADAASLGVIEVRPGGH